VKRGAPDGAKGAAGRLDALAPSWSVDSAALAKLVELLGLVSEDPRAATSVREPAEGAHVHVADSLSALPWLDGLGPGARVADIGSGAGFPGLAVAIARPALHVDLVESGARKCEFLEDAARRLELTNVGVVNRRAEEWAAEEGREGYGAVLARAIAPLATLVEYAAPLLSAQGRLIAWKGERDPAAERSAELAAAKAGMRPVSIERVHPYPRSRAHNLHLYEKVSPTPAGLPRRPGMARKRPLA
jgi:16S rRNA (guanine527-N7)-methyltransferase